MFHNRFDPFGSLSRHPRPLRFAAYFADGDGDGGGGAGGDGDGGDGGDDQSAAWAAKEATLIAESKKYRLRAQAAEASIADLEGKVLSEEDRAVFDKLKAAAADDEQKRLEAAGKYDELIAAKDAKHKEALAAVQATADAATELARRVAGTDQLKTALAAEGVKAVDQAAYLLDRYIKVEIADGTPVVAVVDDDGKPIHDPDEDGVVPISIAKFVKNWLAKSGAHYLPPSRDTGSGGHKGGGEHHITIEELDADPVKAAAFIQEHGQAEYHKLARAKKK